MTFTQRAATLLLTALAITPAARAQDRELEIDQKGEAQSDAFTDQPREQRPLRFRFRIGGSHTFEADLEDGGDVAVNRLASGFSATIPAAERLDVGLGVDSEYSGYDFGGVDFAGASDPFDDLLSVGFTPTLIYRLDDQWSIFGGPRFEFAGEFDADTGDSFKIGGFAGVRYQFSEKSYFSLALGVFERLEDDPLIIPFPGFNWQINEKTRLYTEADRVGPGLALERRINDDFAVSLFARYEPRDFRLSEEAFFSEGVVQDDRVTLGAFARWNPARNVELDVAVGGVVFQEFEIFDEDGDSITTPETDPALQAGLRLRIRF